MVNQNISQETNTHALVLCLIVSIVFVIVRGFARYFKLQKFPSDAEDIAIYIALVSFLVMTSLYLAAMPTLYPVQLVSAGLIPPYASMMKDVTAMLHEFFAVQLFFWLTLWAVKCSLLFMFQRLTTGIQSYTRVWWGVMVFTILTFVGCVISQFTSCSSMHAWFTAGLCETPADNVAKTASLWYSLAVDLLTDLMIMIVPIQILYNLQISTAQKLSVGVVFSVGIITMVFAIVRVVSLDTSVRATGQVSTTWLILWAGLEGTVAIIVGCLPAFAVFIRGRVEASRSAFSRNPKSSSPSSNSISIPGTSTFASTRAKASLARARIESISLNDIEAAVLPPTRSLDGESRKGLVERDGITITQAWTQKWHEGGSDDFEREKSRKLGLNGVGAL